jgi:hypothetical protein
MVRSVTEAEGDALRERLVVLFEGARVTLVEMLRKAGIPLVERVTRPIVERHETGWRTEQIEGSSSVLLERPPLFRFSEEPVMLPAWIDEARSLARDLTARYGASLPPRPPFDEPGRELLGRNWPEGGDDAADVLLRYIAAPTWTYLTALATMEHPDRELAARLAREVTELLTTGRFTVRQSIPLELQPQVAEFAEGSARLRRLDELEQGEFLEATNRRSSSRMVVFAPLSPLQLVTHLLEVETEGTTPGSLTLTPRTRLLTALQLHGVRPAGPGSIVYSILPDWYFSARSGGRIPIAKGLDAGDGELNNEQFVAACRTAVLLDNYDVRTPTRPAELALRRFEIGSGRDDAVDGLVDFVIALEALLLPEDRAVGNAEVSYRFRMHGAHFIADVASERQQIYDDLQKLYRLRSDIVHGGQRVDPRDLEAGWRAARGLAARGLLKAVHDGFPTVADFRKMLLNAE